MLVSESLMKLVELFRRVVLCIWSPSSVACRAADHDWITIAIKFARIHERGVVRDVNRDRVELSWFGILRLSFGDRLTRFERVRVNVRSCEADQTDGDYAKKS